MSIRGPLGFSSLLWNSQASFCCFATSLCTIHEGHSESKFPFRAAVFKLWFAKVFFVMVDFPEKCEKFSKTHKQGCVFFLQYRNIGLLFLHPRKGRQNKCPLVTLLVMWVVAFWLSVKFMLVRIRFTVVPL